MHRRRILCRSSQNAHFIRHAITADYAARSGRMLRENINGSRVRIYPLLPRNVVFRKTRRVIRTYAALSNSRFENPRSVLLGKLTRAHSFDLFCHVQFPLACRPFYPDAKRRLVAVNIFAFGISHHIGSIPTGCLLAIDRVLGPATMNMHERVLLENVSIEHHRSRMRTRSTRAV